MMHHPFPPALMTRRPLFRTTALALTACLTLTACKEDTSSTGPAPDPQAVARGETLVRDCRACHALSGQENLVGPTLAGVVGRPAGAIEGYEYSQDIQSADFSWTPEKLSAFLSDPFALLPGTKMPSPGEYEAGQIDDIIAYLQTLK